ncbi:MAG: hypothetical protein WCK33_00110 [Phycisphaerae bacterium]|jgi:hypothetical protein
MREFLKKHPSLGWILCAALLGVTAWLWFKRGAEESPFSPERMQEMVTIKYADTGETAQMPRGRFEKMLRDAGTKLDPQQGLINPKTGKPTGFLFDQREWEQAVARVNEQIDRARAKLPEDVRRQIKDGPGNLPAGPEPAGGTSGPPAGAEPSAPKNPR